MTWARIDDGFNENPKVRSVSLAARWTFIASLCHAGRRRDPHIHASSLNLLDATLKVAGELERAGLWDVNGDGWVIHDWDEYQAPMTSTERSQERRRSAQ